MKLKKAPAFCFALLLSSPANAIMVDLPSQGIEFPGIPTVGPYISNCCNTIGSVTSGTTKVAFICRVFQKDWWFQRGSGTKNLSHISFSTNTRGAGTATIQADIEGVSTAAGPPGQPDGVIAAGGNALATQALNSTTSAGWDSTFPSFNSPVPVTNGQLIAICLQRAIIYQRDLQPTGRRDGD